jgi:hypothetical protein
MEKSIIFDEKIAWFDFIKFFIASASIIAVIYFIGSCVVTPTYKMRAMSGDFFDFDRAIAGQVPIQTLDSPNLRELSQITKISIEKSDLSLVESRLNNLQETCKQTCAKKELQPWNLPHYYNYGYNTESVCSYGPSCTKIEYETHEHLKDMLDAGILTKEKMNHHVVNYPTYGSWLARVVWVWLGGFILSAVIVLCLAFIRKVQKLIKVSQKKTIVKAQKIHDKVRVLATYKTPGFSEEVSSKSLRMQLEMNLIEEQDQPDAVRAVRFLERNGR